MRTLLRAVLIDFRGMRRLDVEREHTRVGLESPYTVKPLYNGTSVFELPKPNETITGDLY